MLTKNIKNIVFSFLSGALLFAPAGVIAKPVGIDVAKKIARVWITDNAVFRKEVAQLSAGDFFSVQAVSPLLKGKKGNVLAYHVDLAPQGYLVVSADDLLQPVICYSAVSNLDFSDRSDNAFRALLQHDLLQADTFVGESHSLKVRENRQSKWQKLLDRFTEIAALQAASLDGAQTADSLSSLDSPVGPLLTTEWNQNRHYNDLCPDDPLASAYYDGKMPAGCVAVAAAQIMKYHEWPPRGNGQHSYEWNGEILSSLYTDTFDWLNMKDSYDPWSVEPVVEVDAVAELIYEVGVSVDMNYAHNGSASSPVDLASSLANYFYYNSGLFTRRDTDPIAFDANLQAEIFAGRPVVSVIPFHAIVVDGLNLAEGDDYFHLNYGWGGNNNGWYFLSLEPEDSAVTGAVFDLKPVFFPLLQELPYEIDSDGRFILKWDFPRTRINEVTEFKVWEGQYELHDFFDEADDFHNWRNGGGWQLDFPGYDETGTAFYVNPLLLGNYVLTLADPVAIPVGASSFLTFYYKAVIKAAHFFVETSIDNGLTWDEHFNLTDYQSNPGNPWNQAQIDLTPYAGESLLVRLRNKFEYGLYYPPPDGGVWIDNINISGIEQLSWHLIVDQLPDGLREHEMRDVADGSYFYAVQACDEASCYERSPAENMTVSIFFTGDFDLDGDVDGLDLVNFITGEGDLSIETFSGAFGAQSP